MRPINLSPAEKTVWDTLTKQQKDVITILVENYYEITDGTFTEAININDVDAGTYTTVDQYLVWRSITPTQKLVVAQAYAKMDEVNAAQLMLDYDEQEVYNMSIPYDVYVLYRLFSLMNGDITFTFFH